MDTSLSLKQLKQHLAYLDSRFSHAENLNTQHRVSLAYLHALACRLEERAQHEIPGPLQAKVASLLEQLSATSDAHSAVAGLPESSGEREDGSPLQYLCHMLGQAGFTNYMGASNRLESRADAVIQHQHKAELKSFKAYQSMLEKMSVERLLAKVMQEIPENAGPLNPERLLIRSFMTLQSLSPAYISRLLAYYDSLLSLQLMNSDR